MKTTIEIGEAEIVRLVRDHFAKDMKNPSAALEVHHVQRGYGTSEYTEHEIRCTIVEVKE